MDSRLDNSSLQIPSLPMQTLLAAGYPKSGNTLLGSAFSIAGNIANSEYSEATLFDIYTINRLIKDSGYRVCANPALTNCQVHIKTHDSFRRQSLDSKYFGDVSGVILISRNPFDTFLSSLNYLRVLVREANMVLPIVHKTLGRLSPGIKLPEDPKEFIKNYSIESLKNEGLLDGMLHEYVDSGTVFEPFMSMSGPWALFAHTYDFSGKPILHVQFEEMVSGSQDNYAKISNKLASFAGCNAAILAASFKRQRERAVSEQKGGNIFFSKMKSNYFKDYFSPSSLRRFASAYHSSMSELGYEEILDDLFGKRILAVNSLAKEVAAMRPTASSLRFEIKELQDLNRSLSKSISSLNKLCKSLPSESLGVRDS